MPLAKRLQKIPKKPKRKIPLWQGPTSEEPQGGLTNSLLCQYLVCKERFRILTILGIKKQEGWNHRLGYGQMWHTCEESFAKGKGNTWEVDLKKYCVEQARENQLDSQHIEHWWRVCRVQFPAYVGYWKKLPSVKNRKPVSQEEEFAVPYKLPSGRVVILRGKIDEIYQIGNRLGIKENKSKGDIKAEQLRRQLTFDIQTMIYVIAGRELYGDKLGELDYNVIRRPLSGGAFSITQKKGRGKAKSGAETPDEFYARLGGLIQQEAKDAVKEKRDCWFFMRWKVPISEHDIQVFKDTCFDPLLEEICDWYEHMERIKFGEPWNYINTKPASNRHYRLPYGIYNSLAEGYSTPVDEYLASGSMIGLTYTDNLFPELS